MAAPEWSSSFTSHYDVIHWREQVYLSGIRSGSFVPFVYPFFLYGGALLTLHMLVPALRGLAARLTTFCLIAAFYVWVILRCRAYSAPAGFAIGILSAWHILWAAVVLIFTDAKRNFQRIKLGPVEGRDKSASKLKSIRDTAPSTNGNSVAAAPNGSANGKPHANGHANGSSTNAASKVALTPYNWQPYPKENFVDRVAWTVDLLSNFRGIGWNWKITGLPSRPPRVEASLREEDAAEIAKQDHPVSSTGRTRFDSTAELLRHNASIVLVGYLVLDLLKTFIVHDPYFWGLTDRPPPTYLPDFIQASTILTNVYRQAVALAFIWASLRTIFSLAPFLYVGILGSKRLGAIGEPWMYPDHYGSYRTVLDRGMAGWWGGWWHQTFRYVFQAGGRWLATDVLRLKKNSPVSAVVELCTSFNLSGLLHAAACLTMIGDTRPWTHSVVFFALQPFGIIAGLIWGHLLKQAGVSRRIPRLVGWVSNFFWVHVWLYFTLPLLFEDLVRGGLLLWEPVPLSPLRGLGFGVSGDGFYCWGRSGVALRTDGPWWMRGVSL